MNNKVLNLLIVDDEAPARQRLRDIVTDNTEKLAVEIVAEAANGREALEMLSVHKVDIVLLDIRMPEMDGIEVAQHINKLPEPPGIIFTTAYDDYAIRAFELHAIDYLLKPIRGERLLDAMIRGVPRVPTDALQAVQSVARTHLSVHERGKILLIPIEDVIYLKAEMKYVTLRTVEREYLLEESLIRLEEEYVSLFVRIHRNSLVAKKAITGFEKVLDDRGDHYWAVLLEGISEKLAVSRRQWPLVKDLVKAA